MGCYDCGEEDEVFAQVLGLKVIASSLEIGWSGKRSWIYICILWRKSTINLQGFRIL